MACYVDDSIHAFGNMIMCHLVADSLEELFRMVDTIGVDRKWFQDKPGGTPHFDISKSKRALAVKAGALEVSRHGMAALSAEWRLADLGGRGRTSIEVPSPIPSSQQEWSAWNADYKRRKLAYMESLKS